MQKLSRPFLMIIIALLVVLIMIPSKNIPRTVTPTLLEMKNSVNIQLNTSIPNQKFLHNLV